MAYAPFSLEDEEENKISSALKVPVHKIVLADSYLIGSMMAGNSNGMIFSGMASIDGLNGFGDRNTLVLKDKINAIGNDIVANDHAALIHRGFSKNSVKQIEDCLGVEAIKSSIGGIKTVGSVAVLTPKGMLVTPTATEEEVDFLSHLFHVNVKLGTANFGSIYVGSSMVANSKGVLIGSRSTPIEVGRADEVFA